MSFRVLSTKLLSPGQQQLLLNSDVSFVHANFIGIAPLPFDQEDTVENAIFTSKNALRFVAKKSVIIKNTFCVGPKSKAMAEAQGYLVIESANNAESLAQSIVENHARRSFVFFSGARRRDILPKILKAHKISFKEVTVYNTLLTPKTFGGSYDGVLFFSPSAVESFIEYNDLNNTVCFCIGETTAAIAEKYSNDIITAKIPSVENVLIQVIKYSKENTN